MITTTMEISRNDQIEFANAILILIKKSKDDMEQLDSLNKLSSLLVSWSGNNNDIAVNLSEYLYEYTSVARGEEDTGWKDEFKKKLLEEISFTGINDQPKT